MTDERMKRLRIRCWRRGTKEMDLLLGPFADALAEGRADADLDALEALLGENDQDLYRWISGTAEAPPVHIGMVDTVRRFHRIPV